MGRFSPQNQGTADLWLGFADDIDRMFSERRDRRRQQQIDQERKDEVSYDRQRDALNDQVAFEERTRRDDRYRDEQALQDVELAREGLYRGTAPEDQAPTAGDWEFPELTVPDDVMDGAGGLGLQRQEVQAPPVYSNARFQAPGGPGAGGNLADDIEGYTSGRTALAEPEVVALPGQFVPGMGFTPKAILSAPPIAPEAPRYTPPRPARTHRQLTPEFYEVEQETPRYREEQERRTRLSGMREAAIAAGATEEEAALLEFDDGLLDDIIDPTPKRGTEEWYDLLEREESARRRGRGTSGEDGDVVRPTYSQAYESLKERYAEFGEADGYGGEAPFLGWAIPLDQIQEMAQEWASTGVMPGGDEGGPARGFGGAARPDAPMSAGFEGLYGPEEGEETGDGSGYAGVIPASFLAAASDAQLEEAGYTPEEIDEARRTQR